MKKELSPGVVIAIIAVAALIFIGAAVWVWQRPSAPAAATVQAHPHPGGAQEMMAAMRAAHMGRSQGQTPAAQNGAPGSQ